MTKDQKIIIDGAGYIVSLLYIWDGFAKNIFLTTPIHTIQYESTGTGTRLAA